MNFNPLRPCGRRPPADPGIDWNHQHFNPLRPCGRRLSKQIIHEGSRRFQSTPPVWAETSMTASTRSNTLNFNPLRPCGRRPIARPPPAYQCRISIHSARVGGDPTNAGKTAPDQTFQSTPPVWAETGNGWPTSRSYLISIHSARVGGDKVDGRIDLDAVISIHSARVGGDITPAADHPTRTYNFNPLRPCGRRQQKKPFFRLLSISITTYFTEKSKRTRCKFSHLGYLFQYSLLILVRTSLYVDV